MGVGPDPGSGDANGARWPAADGCSANTTANTKTAAMNERMAAYYVHAIFVRNRTRQDHLETDGWLHPFPFDAARGCVAPGPPLPFSDLRHVEARRHHGHADARRLDQPAYRPGHRSEGR